MSETVQWIDPYGTTTTFPIESMSGRFMPAVDKSEYAPPTAAGSRLRAVRHGPAEVTLVTDFDPQAPASLRAQLRALTRALDPTQGDGVLRVTGPSAEVRDLVCRYHDGMGLEEEKDFYQRAVLVFRTTDEPYWQDAADTTIDTVVGTLATFFPILPLRLSGSEVFGSYAVDNTGDAPAWPVWTFQGPGSGIVVRNLTTGKIASLTDPDVPIGVGETITIDTRPRRKSVTKGDGSTLFSNLTTTSTLWPLVRGSNSLQIEMTGTTSSSLARLAYRRRFLSA